MRIARTIFALTLMLAVAGLPIAGAAAADPAAAGAHGSAHGSALGPSTVEMSMSDSAHDCCPKADAPCGNGIDGCAGMAACATTCIPWLASASSRLDYHPALVSRVAARPSGDLRSLLGDPPLRPPRV